MIDPDYIKVGVSTVATITAIIFISLTYIFPERAILWLSIEVILLPSIYVVGSVIAERLMKEQHNKSLRKAIEKSEQLNEKYYILLYEHTLLQEREEKWREKNQ